MKLLRTIFVLMLAVAAVGIGSPAGGRTKTPLWVEHVRTFEGGISGSVRARLLAQEASAVATTAPDLENVRASTDPAENLPQNETAVALNPNDPFNAVAAANDWVTDGLWIGHTTDGGRTWSNEFREPFDSEPCVGADPSVAYSVRDSAFYISTLCYHFDRAENSVQVWKSVDGGATWTAPEDGSIVIRTDDPALFYDKELIRVDNEPSSPRFGRVYVTYIKFHMLANANARSDYCPVQVGYTDEIPTADPRSAVWTNNAVVPDDPGSNGRGPGANQWAMPVVDDQGGLDIAYASEDCNTGIDRAMFFVRSTDGGATFSDPVRIDKLGQWVDRRNRNDHVPNKKGGVPLSPSLVFNPVTGSLVWAFSNAINAGRSGLDLSVQRSTDYGQTWSDARFLAVTGTGAPAPQDQFFPWLAADESGRLHAMWYDNRNDQNNRLIETFQGLSTDDGLTWSNFNISEVPWDPNDSFFACGCFFGDYNAIAASDEVIYPVWTDGRLTPGKPAGATDIFVNIEIAD